MTVNLCQSIFIIMINFAKFMESRKKDKLKRYFWENAKFRALKTMIRL